MRFNLFKRKEIKTFSRNTDDDRGTAVGKVSLKLFCLQENYLIMGLKNHFYRMFKYELAAISTVFLVS